MAMRVFLLKVREFTFLTSIQFRLKVEGFQESVTTPVGSESRFRATPH